MLNTGYIKHKGRDFFFEYCVQPVSLFLYLVSRLAVAFGLPQVAVKALLMSIRYSYFRKSQDFLYAKFKDFEFSTLLSTPASKADAEGRAIILSAPLVEDSGHFRKGVILLTFSHTFSYFLKHENWDYLNKNFAFVLEPSWAGYADPDILAFVQQADHCIIQASEIKDRVLMNLMFPLVPCMDTGASNWIDDDFFNDRDFQHEKEFDAIYVANLNPIKRVFRAIDLAHEIVQDNRDFSMAIVCASWGGGNFDELKGYISSKGLEKSLFLFEGVSQDKLIQLVLKSKCSFLLSFKEGSNRVLFESMFLNVPVVCISENVGVNKSYVNCYTGLLVPDKSMAGALNFMSKYHKSFSPRQWALKNISPDVTTKKLSTVIDGFYGDEVNSNLKVKVNSPEVKYRGSQALTSRFLTNLLSSRSEGEFDLQCRNIIKDLY